jgi:hypothetical protein
MNGDGISGNDLMYIPKDQSQAEMNFQQYTNTTNGVTYTIQEQKDAFEAFIQQDSYLRKHRGEIAKRNGVLMPMLTRFDLSAMVELFKNIGKQKHTIQFRADIFNVGNLINNKWGVADLINNTAPIAARAPLSSAPNVPLFRMNIANSNTSSNNIKYETYRQGTSIADVWQGQIGIRYIF